jgi:hypothetical protein
MENDRHHFFPILGICLGFQMLCLSELKTDQIVQDISSKKDGLIIKRHSNIGLCNCNLKNRFEKVIKLPYTDNNINLFYFSNERIIPYKYNKLDHLDILGIYKNKAKDSIICTVKHRTYPFIGYQFHPEKKTQLKSDYIKKDDVRMSLAELGKAFSNMAKDREIPVVSAMQLNREATVKIEAGADNIEDYFKNLKSVGASNVAESLKLIQLVDLAMMIDKRKSEIPGDPDSLTFRIVKTRQEINGPTATRMHTHSFIKDNGMRLEEDIFDKVSKSTPIVNQEPGAIRGSSAPKLTPRR